MNNKKILKQCKRNCTYWNREEKICELTDKGKKYHSHRFNGICPFVWEIFEMKKYINGRKFAIDITDVCISESILFN